MILRHVPSSYKLSVDQRPPIVAKVRFPQQPLRSSEREIKEESQTPVHHLLCQISGDQSSEQLPSNENLEAYL